MYVVYNFFFIGYIISLITAVCILTAVVLACACFNCYRSHLKNISLSNVRDNVELRDVDCDTIYGYNEINEDNIPVGIPRDNTNLNPPQLPYRHEPVINKNKPEKLKVENEIGLHDERHCRSHQPLIENKTDIINECKLTCNSKKKNDYLNPYQPVFENKTVHEYASTSKAREETHLNSNQQNQVKVHEYGFGGEEKINVDHPIIQRKIHDCMSTGEEIEDPSHRNSYQQIQTEQIVNHDYDSTVEVIEDTLQNPDQPILFERTGTQEYKACDKDKINDYHPV